MGMEHLGTNVRRLRLARGWTQQDLADHAEVSQQLVSAIEGGGRTGRVETLMKLAGALGVALGDLTAAPKGVAPAVPEGQGEASHV